MVGDWRMKEKEREEEEMGKWRRGRRREDGLRGSTRRRRRWRRSLRYAGEEEGAGSGGRVGGGRGKVRGGGVRMPEEEAVRVGVTYEVGVPGGDPSDAGSCEATVVPHQNRRCFA